MLYKNDLIFDIGMHEGEDTRFYLSRHYNVVAVEANPELVERNKKKFSSFIDAGRLTIVNVGLAQSEGILPFYVNKHSSEWSSFDKNIGTRNNTPHEILDVPCKTANQLFSEFGIPYYLKVDIEGFDFLALEGIPESGDKPAFVSCEANEIAWLDILKSKGYTKFKLINQANSFEQLSPSLEMNSLYIIYRRAKHAVKHKLRKIMPGKYVGGSSGPFGDETKGPWKSYEEVREDYLEYMQGDRNTPINNISWCDFHAAL